MKRIITFILILAVLCAPVYAREVTLYSIDGREITVRSEKAERLRFKGWYNREEVYTAVFSPEGETAETLNTELELWKSKGWSNELSDVQSTLYSEDGSEITVWNAQVPDCTAEGWCLTIEEVQTTLYGDDGSEITVWNAHVPDYTAKGWHLTAEEAQTTLYSEDGRDITVWNAEVEACLAVGWYRTKGEVQTTLYNSAGKEITVWNAEVEAYIADGWSYTRPRPDGTKPMVALTFDDGPGPYTDKILSCLSKYGAKATFFVVGNRLNKYPSALKREAELGMEIGCHTWNHKQLTTLDSGGIKNEITRTNNLVKELTGVYPATVRPPYGSHNAAVRSAAGGPIIMWSIDTLDWKTKNADSTYNSVINNVKDGDIILMHDIHAPTADAVERIVPALIERGYQLVTVSELGEYRKGGLVNGQAYSKITN